MINCEAVSSLAPINPPATPKDDGHSSAPMFVKNFMQLDERLSASLHRKGQQVRRTYFQALEYSGDGRFWVTVTAAMLLAPPLPHLNFKPFLLNLLLGFVLDLLVVGALKHLVRRPRPSYNKGMHLIVAVDHWSFPSGHATRTFFIATYCWMHHGLWAQAVSAVLSPDQPPSLLGTVVERLLLCLLLATVSAWATATASSRILLGRHYLLDVVTGCVVGVAEGFLVCYSLGTQNSLSTVPKHS